MFGWDTCYLAFFPKSVFSPPAYLGSDLQEFQVNRITDSGIFWCHITVTISLCNHQSCFCFTSLDPEHQRAKGNLKYFEFQLEKLRKAAEAEALKKKEGGVSEKIEKKPKKKISNQPMPERKKYEMLCRGEGLRMVRNTLTKTMKHNWLQTCPWHFSLNCILCWFPSPLNQTPRRQSRLFCRYYDNNHNPKYVLAPVKQEDEWDRPYIVRFIDIISDKEIQRVKELAKPRVSHSVFAVCRNAGAATMKKTSLFPKMFCLFNVLFCFPPIV